MALTESKMLALGTKAPSFHLTDTVSGKLVSLDDFQNQNAYVIMFLCNHCPYVIHINPEIVRLCKDYKNKGVAFVAISSNDIDKYPQDGPELMKENARMEQYPFPYLYDETQEVAKAYHAACTPDFSIFDKDLLCVYRGQLDDSRPKNDSIADGKDIRAALDNILAGIPVSEQQIPSLGCNIKWKNN